MRRHDALFIGGRWVSSAGHDRIAVEDPYSETTIGQVPAGAPEDVDRAVAAAREALPDWASTPVEDRCRLLEVVALELERRREQLAVLISSEVGTPLRHSYPVQADLPVADIRVSAEAARAFPFEEELGPSLVVREPVGVVAAITPWNFPLHQLAAKVSGALLAGCTIVIKPSELAPLSSFVLVEACDAAGLPPGVVNQVTGFGRTVGEALVAHAGVDMVSFTGSTAAGRRVAELASHGVKKVALELGGKSAAIVLDDADLPAALRGCLASCYLNAGQTCNAHTRLLVPRDQLAEAEHLAAELAPRFVCGDPLEATTRLGPVISERQRERVRAYIATARTEGAKLITGGEKPPDGHDRGFFIRPTVFSAVSAQMRIAQEEVFGPVLAVMPYDGQDDGVRIANDSAYGLSAGVWSSDPARAEGVARRLRAGQVDINGAPFNPAAPFGGVRQSGYGRELGRFGIEECTACKSIQR